MSEIPDPRIDDTDATICPYCWRRSPGGGLCDLCRAEEEYEQWKARIDE